MLDPPCREFPSIDKTARAFEVSFAVMRAVQS